ncbi:MAG: VIT1/CCC1 family protein [Aigarchaeota archaeon]|nr:VIT1/CCC1 family protein [Candidatus Pelearchaeum maunauluense]
MDDIRGFCRDEYVDYTVYRELARREKNEGRRKILESLAATEYEHYRFWSKTLGGYEPRVSGLFIKLFHVMRVLFGLTFTLKLLERHEEEVIRGYKRYAATLSGDEKALVEEIIQQEEEHERYFMSQIDEGVVRYMSFIVLGLADAIVEITGVHAGFLGVTSSTLIAGIAGLVVGFAAAISMASAAYLQAKQDIARSPVISALTTGVSYIGAVAVLALPYFLTEDMITAFTVSVMLAVLLTAAFTFYGAVINERSFKREFAESVALILGTAFATYLFGDFLGRLFGVQQAVSLF